MKLNADAARLRARELESVAQGTLREAGNLIGDGNLRDAADVAEDAVKLIRRAGRLRARIAAQEAADPKPEPRSLTGCRICGDVNTVDAPWAGGPLCRGCRDIVATEAAAF